MATQGTSDGGYYAIKGFSYQLDKAILEILDATDENQYINIEQIQDVSLDDRVIQVKYKETAKLTPSQINKPISQLIEEHKRDSTKKYILYAYFDDLNGYRDKVDEDKKISRVTLDELLGNLKDNFTEEEKNDFVTNFYLDFSPEFQTQFNSVILKLKNLSFIGDTDAEAIFYYANISDFLYKLINNNSTGLIQNRSCTQKEIYNYLKNGKYLICESGFREYLGDQEYFKFIKNQHFSRRNIDYFERFVVIELNGGENLANIKEIVFKVKDYFYIKSGTWHGQKIKSPAPYIYIKNITENDLVNLKTELLAEGYIFKDGFDFAGANFSLSSIKESSTIHNKLCLKLINNEDILKTLVSESFSRPKEIYQFYINSGVQIELDVKNIMIQIENISDIKFIL